MQTYTFCPFSNPEQKMDGDYLIRFEEVEENLFKLPPGFRFYPTDVELITHYLSLKALDCGFCSRAIGEVDLNKVEPWELPRSAEMGKKEWYFFCMRERKYPTGMRTNRATEAGYWKATGKDKEIYRMKVLVGMKKTLVFYMGRAPKGVKTNWVMHEYRLEGGSSHNLQNYSKNEWVICRVFQKTTGRKRADIPVLIQPNEFQNSSTVLSPLMDSSQYNCNSSMTVARGLEASPSHVSCFSNLIEDVTTCQNDTAREVSEIERRRQCIESRVSRLFRPQTASTGVVPGNLMQSSGTKYLNPGFASAPLCFDGVDGGDHLHQQPVDLDCFWQY